MLGSMWRLLSSLLFWQGSLLIEKVVCSCVYISRFLQVYICNHVKIRKHIFMSRRKCTLILGISILFDISVWKWFRSSWIIKVECWNLLTVMLSLYHLRNMIDVLFHKPFEGKEAPKLCPIFRIQFLEEFFTAKREERWEFCEWSRW